VYVEFDGGTPAIVREYGEPLTAMSGADYTTLERELYDIERRRGWGVHDELALYRRADGSVFVGDVGFWTAPRKPAKGQKRRSWRAINSDLNDLLKQSQRTYHFGPVPTLAHLWRLSDAIASDLRLVKSDGVYLELVTEYLEELEDAARRRDDAGVQNPTDVVRVIGVARRAIAPRPSRRKR